MIYSLSKTALAAALVVAAGSAFAAPTTFDFANLTWNGTTNSGFLPTDGVKCTGGDLCSSDVNHSVFNGDLTFVQGSLSVAATGTWTHTVNTGTRRHPIYTAQTDVAAVVQDHDNGYNAARNIGAGLGVYHMLDNSDDNITVGETLKMSFSQVVNLGSIGLRSEGHNTSWNPGSQFQYSQDGTHWTSAALVASKTMNMTGKDFYFRYGSDQNYCADQFYLSGMTVTAVPEPETYAMLLAGLGLMGAVARRRKGKQA